MRHQGCLPGTTGADRSPARRGERKREEEKGGGRERGVKGGGGKGGRGMRGRDTHMKVEDIIHYVILVTILLESAARRYCAEWSRVIRMCGSTS